jgi:hypothetical protein
MHAEGDSFVRLHTRSAWQIARLCSDFACRSRSTTQAPEPSSSAICAAGSRRRDNCYRFRGRRPRRTLRPGSGDVEDFPTPFPVRGREAVPVIPEFGGPFPGFTLDEGSHRCLVEILENDRDSWRVLLDFELHVTGDAEKRKAYLAYSNLAEDPRAKERAEAAAADLLAKLKRKRPPPSP